MPAHARAQAQAQANAISAWQTMWTNKSESEFGYAIADTLTGTASTSQEHRNGSEEAALSGDRDLTLTAPRGNPTTPRGCTAGVQGTVCGPTRTL